MVEENELKMRELTDIKRKDISTKGAQSVNVGKSMPRNSSVLRYGTGSRCLSTCSQTAEGRNRSNPLST